MMFPHPWHWVAFLVPFTILAIGSIIAIGRYNDRHHTDD